MSFKCPKCGGSTWGTDATRNLGCCHGLMRPTGNNTPALPVYPCTFTWSRDDDEEYGIQRSNEEPVTGITDRGISP